VSEAYGFLLVGFALGLLVAWWIIRPPVIRTPQAPVVTVDWNSIKAGITDDKRIIVFNQVDWNLLNAVADSAGYELTPKQVKH